MVLPKGFACIHSYDTAGATGILILAHYLYHRSVLRHDYHTPPKKKRLQQIGSENEPVSHR
jgi:hypothetical protein